MKALIDADIVVYRCAAATADKDEGLACWQADEMINRIIDETASDSYTCFLTGGGNFRFGLYPEYKANRKDMAKPKHWACLREHIVSNWGATVSDGCEADDMMGVAQMKWMKPFLEGEGPDPALETVICSIDKDMLMIPGQHYNFVNKQLREVNELEGIRHLYWQAIMGDKVDNIPGFDGLMRSKVPKKMEWMIKTLNTLIEEEDMYDFVSSLHSASVDLETCLKCLWIWRSEGDIWKSLSERVV